MATTPSELTVIVPTLNERHNVTPFLDLLELALAGITWEVIFVDDNSPDGTANAVRSIACRDGRVRCLQRIGRRGLSTACIEGVFASASPYVAVMDADLQHDERLLPQMLDTLKSEPCDIVVGSRYVAGGSVGNWDSSRINISRFATSLGRLICKTAVADPMSGFFMVRREVFERNVRNLSGQGFKILLDLLASSPEPLCLKEIPFQFRQRKHGSSKLDTLVIVEFGMLLIDKIVGLMPVQLALLALLGILALALHLSVLWFGLDILALGFLLSQATATIITMTFNFFFDNLLLHRDQRLTGWPLIRGLVSFYLTRGVGALANVGIATYALAAGNRWWLAGICGALVGLLWNCAVSSTIANSRCGS